MIALTALMLIPVVVQGKGWSDNVRIAAGEMPELSYVSAWIRQNLMPIQTSLLSIVPIFLFWLTMTWSILLCGLLGYGPQGVILYSVVLMLDTILMVDTPEFFLFVFRNGAVFLHLFNGVHRIAANVANRYARRVEKLSHLSC